MFEMTIPKWREMTMFHSLPLVMTMSHVETYQKMTMFGYFLTFDQKYYK